MVKVVSCLAASEIRQSWEMSSRLVTSEYLSVGDSGSSRAASLSKFYAAQEKGVSQLKTKGASILTQRCAGMPANYKYHVVLPDVALKTIEDRSSVKISETRSFQDCLNNCLSTSFDFCRSLGNKTGAAFKTVMAMMPIILRLTCYIDPQPHTKVSGLNASFAGFGLGVENPSPGPKKISLKVDSRNHLGRRLATKPIHCCSDQSSAGVRRRSPCCLHQPTEAADA